MVVREQHRLQHLHVVDGLQTGGLEGVPSPFKVAQAHLTKRVGGHVDGRLARAVRGGGGGGAGSGACWGGDEGRGANEHGGEYGGVKLRQSGPLELFIGDLPGL